MKEKPPTTFEDLLKSYYGGPPQKSPRNVSTLRELFSTYYGARHKKHHHKHHGHDHEGHPSGEGHEEHHHKGHHHGSHHHDHDHHEHHHHNGHRRDDDSLALSFDDGEVLVPSGRGVAYREYVVQSSSDSPAYEEYVVYQSSITGARPMSYQSSSNYGGNFESVDYSDGAGNASPEFGIDLRQPLRGGAGMPDISSMIPSLPQMPGLPQMPQLSQIPNIPMLGGGASGSSENFSVRPPALPAGAPPTAPVPMPMAESTAASDDDFIADMKSILMGQKTYDPNSKSTVAKEKPAPPQEPNGQAIFDRIAQSMQYANTYDLGTMELQNRFADFDRMDDIDRRGKDRKKNQPSAPPPLGDNMDFLQDLDRIRSAPRVTPAYSEQASTDKWDKIASDIFGDATYDDFVSKELTSTKFLGQTISSIHGDTVKLLEAAAKDLASTQSAGYKAPPVTDTFRRRAGMHGWGMAIDFDVMNNPCVLNEHGEAELDKELIVAYDHIASFMLGRDKSRIRDLKGGRKKFGSGTIADVYDALRVESDAMKQYFSMMKDSTALTSFLSTDWPKSHSGQTAPDIATVQAQMQDDCEVLGGATSSGSKRATKSGDRPFAPKSSGGKGDPATGFLNLDRPFVIAMTNAGFAWGASDIAGEPGDIHHFDLRLQPTGSKVLSLLHKF
jgi:hypothetical protein